MTTGRYRQRRRTRHQPHHQSYGNAFRSVLESRTVTRLTFRERASLHPIPLLLLVSFVTSEWVSIESACRHCTHFSWRLPGKKATPRRLSQRAGITSPELAANISFDRAIRNYLELRHNHTTRPPVLHAGIRSSPLVNIFPVTGRWTRWHTPRSTWDLAIPLKAR